LFPQEAADLRHDQFLLDKFEVKQVPILARLGYKHHYRVTHSEVPSSDFLNSPKQFTAARQQRLASSKKPAALASDTLIKNAKN
jgi:hypothetical protein